MSKLKIITDEMNMHGNLSLSQLIMHDDKLDVNKVHTYYWRNPVILNDIKCYIKLEFVLKENVYMLLNHDSLVDNTLVGKYKMTILPNLDYFQAIEFNGEIYGETWKYKNDLMFSIWCPIDLTVTNNKYKINNQEFILSEKFIVEEIFRLKYYIPEEEFLSNLL